MIDIDKSISDLMDVLGKEFKILKYVYNQNDTFIPGVTPVYYSGPYWDKREVIAAIKSLLVGSWLASGEQVQSFEKKFVAKINQKYGLMVNSGSSANLIMFAALKKFLKWNDNDEIIISVVGFPTTLAPIIQNNLKPVFIDIEMDTLNFDLNLIQEKITDKTKAIILSPVLGNPPDMDKILDICKKNNIELILDNCDSLGTKWDGKYLNEYAMISSNSLYASHHLSTGHGGIVMSDNNDVMITAKRLTQWGRNCTCMGTQNLLPNGICNNRFDKWLEPKYDGIIDHKYVFGEIGYNLAPLDLQGAIGLVQMTKFDEIHDKRKNSYNKISSILEKNIKDIYIPKALQKSEVSWFGVPIVCKDRELKNKLVEYFEDKKIQTRNYFAGNILLHPGYEHLDDYKKYPNANRVLPEVFFIGASPHYNDDIFNYIDKITKEFVN